MNPLRVNKEPFILPQSFYARDTIIVARELLGKVLVRSINGIELKAMIVETEAYTFDDPASHCFQKKTKSNSAMFGPVGHAYIYFIYGNHFCFNVVAKDKKMPAAGVLIRAVEPLEGIERMKKHRTIANLKNLTNGPGKLTQAMNITKELYGVDLTQNEELFIADGEPIKKSQINAANRIGISKAKELQWRFFICNNSFVSKK